MERRESCIGAVAIGAITALLLAGCTAFSPRPISAEREMDRYTARALTDPGLREFLQNNRETPLPAWPLPTWYLSDLTLAALYFHPDLDLARARLAVAQAAERSAAQVPDLSLSTGAGYNSSSRGISPWILNFNFDLPLETAGKRAYRMAEAAHLERAAKWSLADAAWRVRSRLRSALLQLYAAQRTAALMRVQQRLVEHSQSLLESQLDAGAVSAAEVSQSRIRTSQARLALIDAEAAVASARVELAGAIGLPAGGLEGAILAFDDFTALPGDIPDAAARRQALLNRADVLGALERYAASESALATEVAKQYPDLRLNPGYELDQGDNKWSLGLTLDLPAPSLNRGAIAEAEARRSEAAASFNALQAGVIGEVEQALAAYQAALGKTVSLRALAESLHAQTTTARAMRDLGEITALELAERERETNSGDIAVLQAEVNGQQALGRLEDALQSPADLAQSLWLQTPREADSRSQTAQR